jgi:hypothetical protein
VDSHRKFDLDRRSRRQAGYADRRPRHLAPVTEQFVNRLRRAVGDSGMIGEPG